MIGMHIYDFGGKKRFLKYDRKSTNHERKYLTSLMLKTSVQQNILRWIKLQVSNWEKAFLIYAIGKGLTSKVFKEFPQIKSKKQVTQ